MCGGVNVQLHQQHQWYEPGSWKQCHAPADQASRDAQSRRLPPASPACHCVAIVFSFYAIAMVVEVANGHVRMPPV